MPKQSATRDSILASQSIDAHGPGSILADFEVLLGFIEQGVPSGGEYHLLPMARLFELDQMMTRPLRPRLKRPQQKSFPHLNGLYLLLRATRLGTVEGHGKSATLKLDAAMHEQWLRLNPTERYFNLLEAWLRWGSWEMSGLRGGAWRNRVGWDARELWMLIPAAGYTFPRKASRRREFLYSAERSSTLALLELFGLMTVGRGEPEEGQSWRVTEVRHTAFGDQLLQIVFEQMERALLLAHEEPAADFGAWQPVLQPFFPQWVNNLEFAEPPVRGGVFHFKVSLGRPWRRIAIPAECNLDELAEGIINAFDFDGDHLYGFQFVAHDGRRVRVEHPYVDDASIHTGEMVVGELPLAERQSMRFQYDFGADWRFDVRLEKIEPEAAENSGPMIVESHGEAPPEYDFDEEW